MVNFVDNLVHKAAGLSPLTKLESLLNPGFELPNYGLVSKSEGSVVNTIENIPVISEQGNILSNETYEKMSTDAIVDSHVHPEQEFQKSKKSIKTLEPPIKSSNECKSTKSDIISSGERQTLEKSTRAPTPTQKSSEEDKRSRLVDILPAAGHETLNLMEPENLDPGKSALHFETSTPGIDLGKPADHSISPQLHIRIHNDISKKQPGKKRSPVEAVSKFRVHKRPLEMPPENDTSSLPGKAANRVVNVEPAVEAHQQAFIKDLLTKTSSDISPATSKRSDMKTTEAQHKKEVRVNIGRVEIKASQQASPRLNPPVRGFDDYLMMRVYLDRRYL